MCYIPPLPNQKQNPLLFKGIKSVYCSGKLFPIGFFYKVYSGRTSETDHRILIECTSVVVQSRSYVQRTIREQK